MRMRMMMMMVWEEGLNGLTLNLIQLRVPAGVSSRVVQSYNSWLKATPAQNGGVLGRLCITNKGHHYHFWIFTTPTVVAVFVTTQGTILTQMKCVPLQSPCQDLYKQTNTLNWGADENKSISCVTVTWSGSGVEMRGLIMWNGASPLWNIPSSFPQSRLPYVSVK